MILGNSTRPLPRSSPFMTGVTLTWACRPNHRRSPIATHNAGSSLWMNRQPARASRSSENQTSSAGAPSGAARIGAEDPFELGALLVAQVGAEVEHRLERRVALEVGVAAVEVHESARGEPALLEEHEPDAPAPALDPLLALAALRLATRCPLGAVDARQAALRRARARDALQARGIGDVRGTFREPLQDGLGPLVRRAPRMEPQCHVAIGERIRELLAEAQLTTRDRAPAATTLGASGRRRLEDVGHAREPSSRSQG